MSTNVYIGSTPIYQQYLGSTYGGVKSFIDSDAQSFIDVTGITDASVKLAISDFVLNLKGDGLWDKMVQILPFVGDSETNLTSSFQYNLKDINSYSASYIGGFHGDLNGFQSIYVNQNSGSVLNTNLIPNDIWTSLDTGSHVAIYTTDAGISVDGWDWGVFDQFNTKFDYVIVGRNESAGNTNKNSNLMGTNQITITSAKEAGCYVTSMKTMTGDDFRMRVNGSTLVSTNDTGDLQISSLTAYLGANHRKYTNQVENVDAVTGRKYQFLSVGYGLDETEMDNLQSHIQTFQQKIDTALGTSRAVTI